MLYVLICEDKADSLALRQSVRSQHLQYIDDFDVRFAGPMLAEDHETMVGSIIFLEADDLAGAQAFAASDPYGVAGLFEQVTIRPFKQVVPS